MSSVVLVVLSLGFAGSLGFLVWTVIELVRSLRG